MANDQPLFSMKIVKEVLYDYFYPIIWIYRKMRPLPMAVCLVLTRGNMVLSVSRVDDITKIGLPGGKVEPGEDLKDAACRELFEETGIRVEPKFLVEIHSGIDAKDYRVVTYFVHPAAHIGLEALQQPTEGRPDWVTWETLCNGYFGEYNQKVYKAMDKVNGKVLQLVNNEMTIKDR